MATPAIDLSAGFVAPPQPQTKKDSAIDLSAGFVKAPAAPPPQADAAGVSASEATALRPAGWADNLESWRQEMLNKMGIGGAEETYVGRQSDVARNREEHPYASGFVDMAGGLLRAAHPGELFGRVPAGVLSTAAGEARLFGGSGEDSDTRPWVQKKAGDVADTIGGVLETAQEPLAFLSPESPKAALFMPAYGAAAEGAQQAGQALGIPSEYTRAATNATFAGLGARELIKGNTASRVKTRSGLEIVPRETTPVAAPERQVGNKPSWMTGEAAQEDWDAAKIFGKQETTLPKEDERAPASSFGLPEKVDPASLGVADDHAWLNPNEVQERVQQIQGGEKPRVTTTPEGELTKGHQTAAAAELLGVPVERQVTTDTAEGAGGSPERMREHYFDDKEPTPARVGGDAPFQGGEQQGEPPFPTVPLPEEAMHREVGEETMPRQEGIESPVITQTTPSETMPSVQGEEQPPRYNPEALAPGQTTKQAHANEAGEYNADRLATTHQRYNDSLRMDDLHPPQGRPPEAVITIGGTASGKTSLTDMLMGKDPNRLRFDADQTKLFIDEFEGLKQTDPENAAVRVHDESKYMTKKMLQEGIDRGLDFVYDSTTGGTDAAKLIRALKDRGYTVRVMATDIPVDEAIRRSADRAENSPRPENRGRKVPDKEIRRTHYEAPETFFRIKDMPEIDEISLHDNSGPQFEQAYRRVDGQPEEVYNNGEALERFRDKGQNPPNAGQPAEAGRVGGPAPAGLGAWGNGSIRQGTEGPPASVAGPTGPEQPRPGTATGTAGTASGKLTKGVPPDFKLNAVEESVFGEKDWKALYFKGTDPSDGMQRSLGHMEVAPAPDGRLRIALAEVHPHLEGQGFGTEMYKQALDYARQNGYTGIVSDYEGFSDPRSVKIWKALGGRQVEIAGNPAWQIDTKPLAAEGLTPERGPQPVAAAELHAGLPAPKTLGFQPAQAFARWYDKKIGTPMWEGAQKLRDGALHFDALKQLLTPQGGRPAEYTALKAETKAKADYGAFEGMQLGKRLAVGSQADQQLLGRIVQGELTPGQVRAVGGDPRLQDALEAVRQTRNLLDNDLASRAVMQDLLKDKTFFTNYGKYMPRMYRQFESDYDGMQQKFGTLKPTRLQMDRFMKRGDLPPEVRMLMGEIKEPAYPVAKGIGQLSRNVAYAEMFDKISKNGEWASKTEQEGFSQMPETPRLGKLSGQWVRNDIASDLNEMVRTPSEWGKMWSGVISAYKWNKVVANPASFVWHPTSRVIMNYLGGLPPTRADIYSRAAIDTVKQTGMWERAAKAGAFDPGQVQAGELNDLLDSWNKTSGSAFERIGRLSADIAEKAKSGQWGSAVGQAISPTRGYANEALMGMPAKVTRMYAALEQITKTAKFAHNVELGMDDFQAAQDARKWGVDYENVSKGVQFLRRTGIAPFITYPAQAIPLMMESAVRAPWRLATIGLATYAIQDAMRKKLGISAQDDEQIRAATRSYGEKGTGLESGFMGTGVPGMARYIPILRDKEGRINYLDLAHILHWTGVGQATQPGVQPMGVLDPSTYIAGSPIASIGGPLLTGRDPYTGKDLTLDYPNTGKLGIGAERAAKTFAPSAYFQAQALYRSATGQPGAFGRQPTDLPEQAIGSLTGFNVRPFDADTEQRYRQNEYREQKSALENKIRRVQNDPRVSDADAERQLKMLDKQMDALEKKYDEVFGELPEEALPPAKP